MPAIFLLQWVCFFVGALLCCFAFLIGVLVFWHVAVVSGFRVWEHISLSLNAIPNEASWKSKMHKGGRLCCQFETLLAPISLLYDQVYQTALQDPVELLTMSFLHLLTAVRDVRERLQLWNEDVCAHVWGISSNVKRQKLVKDNASLLHLVVAVPHDLWWWNQEPECRSIILLLCDLHDFSAAILAKKERGLSLYCVICMIVLPSFQWEKIILLLCDLHDFSAAILVKGRGLPSCYVICMILLPSLWRREDTTAASIPGLDCAHTHVCLHTDDVHNFVWKLFWHGWWSANRQQSLHKVDTLQDLIRCSPPTMEKLAAGLLVGKCYCRGPVTRRVNVLHSWFYHFSTCVVYLWCHFLSNWQEESTTVGASDHFCSWMQWGWRFCCVCCLLAVWWILRKMQDNGERRD